MLAFGIDIGYAAVKTAVADENNRIIHTGYALHKGDIRTTLARQLDRAADAFGPENLTLGAATGSGRHILGEQVPGVNEVTALAEAARAAVPEARSVVDIGAQTAKYITGLRHGADIRISMNANCAAGTGAFLEEQVSRLNLDLEDYSAYASRAGSVPRIAGRCSVFAKTDITHHQQEGVGVEDILLGLAFAVVRNFRVSVMKKLPLEKPILFTGGTAHNQGIIKAFREVIGLDDADLIIPDHFSAMGAAGAALLARRQGLGTGITDLLAGTARFRNKPDTGSPDLFSLPPLVSYGRDDSAGKHDLCASVPGQPPRDNGTSPGYYLGIDVGSTSTNLVLCNRDNRVVSYQYLRTLGNPAAAVNKGMAALKAELGGQMKILGTGVTGSGRYLIARMVGTDIVRDEITAQAKAAATLDPDVDTVFEIGGQDSKFICIRDGRVADFQMNKVCAAGTGSFIEEQAKKFNIPVEDFGNMALDSAHPEDLGERCTVFMETALAERLSRGAAVTDLAAGLCYSVVKNYLNRVAGRKKTGKKIVFQGGLAHNQGVVNAFRAILGKPVTVPPYFSVTGALGAAILAREALEAGQSPEKTRTVSLPSPGHPVESRFTRHVREIIFQGHDETPDPGKKTVGLPRALFTFGMFSMFHTFFKTLGFNVVLSRPSDEETIRLAQEHALDETCFPVKLVNGHVAQLAAQNVDYIFFPDLYTINHPGSKSRQNYGCAYMQLAFKIVSRAIDLSAKGITLLSPTIAFHLGPEFMGNSFVRLGQQINRGKQETLEALKAGMAAFHRFEQRLEQSRKQAVERLKPDETAFVLVSKIYGVADPVLNLGIPDRLAEMGYQTLPFFDLPEGDIFQQHPNMYWPFAQHILDPAYLVKEHPNLYAILLTHHGCGPDSVVSHYFGEIMRPKPFLNIEVDEHSSTVGVMTRIEAFVSSISGNSAQKADSMDQYRSDTVHEPVRIIKGFSGLTPGRPLFLPDLPPYSAIFREILCRQGINARILPHTSPASLDRGRQQTVTNEYVSLAALLGDILSALDQEADTGPDTPPAFFIPQTEGAEVDGQYSRFIRTRLDQAGYTEVSLVSPFMEDALTGDPGQLNRIFLGLLAGDLVMLAPARHRNAHLAFITSQIRRNGPDPDTLAGLARTVAKELSHARFENRFLAVGDPLVMFNQALSRQRLSRLEAMGHQVLYTPLSEYMRMFWQDYALQNGRENKALLLGRLATLDTWSGMLHQNLNHRGAFDPDPDRLGAIADNTLGLYAGSNGRYRMAKCLGTDLAVDGIITVSPMYENTGISLNILQQQYNGKIPVLNLTFDGSDNQSDTTRTEAFLFYAGQGRDRKESRTPARTS